MSKSTLVGLRISGALFLMGLSGLAQAASRPATEPVAAHPKTVSATQEPGGQFVQNRKQWPDQVLYAVDVPMGKLFLGKNKLTHALYDVHQADEFQHHGASANARVKAHAYSVTFDRANPNPTIETTGKVPTERNYFLGNDPKLWATHVPAFAEVRYGQLYPGTDLRVYSQKNSLEYDFELAPQADPARIRLRYDGADRLGLAEDGALRITTSVGEVMEQRPYAYQVVNGQRKAVPCHFQLKGQVVSFALPAGYDHAQPLVIDPVLVYSTYSGSTANNYGYTATYDSVGNLYAGGVVFSQGFPVTTGAYDVSFASLRDMGILKFNPAATTPAASLLYATYIGGSGTDHPHSMIVDHAGNLVILGSTDASSFPTTSGAYDVSHNGGTDIVLCKLNNSGNTLLASTFIGGSSGDGQTIGTLQKNYGDNYRGDVQVDTQNNVYFTSVTQSSTFPVVGGFQATFGGASDAVVGKLNSTLSTLQWSSFLGGTGDESGFSLQVDSVRNVFVSGGSTSATLPGTAGSAGPSTHGGTEGFVAYIAASGNTLRRTAYLGTSGYDQAYFVQIDRAGAVYILGQTDGTYPVTAGKYSVTNSRLFIHKLNHDLTTSLFSTQVGAPATTGVNFSPTAFLVDNCGQLLLSAWGGSFNLGAITGAPVTPGAILSTPTGGSFYLMQLAADATSLVYGSYFGTNSPHVDGGTSRFDKRGIIYQSMCVSGGIVTTPNAYSATNRSTYNNAAFKMDILQLQASFVQSNTPTGPNIRRGCAPLLVYFRPASQAGTNLNWQFGDGGTSTQTTGVNHLYTTPGRYVVRLTVLDPTACLQNRTATDTVEVYAVPTFQPSADRTICRGTSTTLTAGPATAGVAYVWTPATGLSSQNGPTVTATPLVTTTYYLTATSLGGCLVRDTVVVHVRPALQVAFTPLATATGNTVLRAGCAPLNVFFRRDTPQAGTSLQWSFGDGTTSAQAGVVSHVFNTPGRYAVQLTVNDTSACPISRTVTDTVTVYAVPTALAGPNQTICLGASATLTAGNAGAAGTTFRWSPTTGLSATTGARVTATPAATTTYTLTATAPGGCTSQATVVVQVNPQPVAVPGTTAREVFTNTPVAFTNASTSATDYLWDFGDGQTSTLATPTHTYTQPGDYRVRLLARVGTASCTDEKTLLIIVRRYDLPNVITPNGDDRNDTFKPFVSFLPVDIKIFNRWGRLVYEKKGYTDSWGDASTPSGVYYYQLTGVEGASWKGWVEVVH
ncbi:PKD domain-containing protein [Hymenobacter sp. M29]|uniref:PKD domain-containing protein n=1 Tax=Hymenobacter mellowenesis TaxID=3063995 RepID=A0ABT9AG85_9BACT|nr:PKD domain-containing protein [Hymenobacter sp. M29]MDO7848876.1 PKD domain-containing protein [Hymenobacter sp. M29]